MKLFLIKFDCPFTNLFILILNEINKIKNKIGWAIAVNNTCTVPVRKTVDKIGIKNSSRKVGPIPNTFLEDGRKKNVRNVHLYSCFFVSIPDNRKRVSPKTRDHQGQVNSACNMYEESSDKRETVHTKREKNPYCFRVIPNRRIHVCQEHCTREKRNFVRAMRAQNENQRKNRVQNWWSHNAPDGRDISAEAYLHIISICATTIESWRFKHCWEREKRTCGVEIKIERNEIPKHDNAGECVVVNRTNFERI